MNPIQLTIEKRSHITLFCYSLSLNSIISNILLMLENEVSRVFIEALIFLRGFVNNCP